MNIAIVGGTHGNEPVGLEVIRLLGENTPNNILHQYKTFQGNPKAYELQKRFVDCDLNRAFGPKGTRQGYEKQRAEELDELIGGKFDLCIDLHTTTTNMGLT
ncbi:MAG: succinylglutamate desuccinylase/aspartoacylase family protein, partial [Bdellovibrionales bacterium]|nr:succinylglutamate desuccinylase/aspartoacylase family protein [Bdellovibrionales bacterium]